MTLFRELGSSSRYLTLPGEALLTSYHRNEPELQLLAVRLAELVEEIPYDDDRFDILIAPLAGQIEKILENDWPYGKKVKTKTISKYVELQLYRLEQGGYWVRLVSDLRAPFSAYNERRKRKTERILDKSVGLTKLRKEEIGTRKMGSLDFGSTYYYLDLSHRIIVKESSWVHDSGEEVRFSKSYFFSDEEQIKGVW